MKNLKKLGLYRLLDLLASKTLAYTKMLTEGANKKRIGYFETAIFHLQNEIRSRIKAVAGPPK